ncbi:hypothetical protein ACHAPT_009454 [Fusarium lateritium]
MRASQFVLFALEGFASWSHAASSSEPFSLYAYGSGIGGLLMFSTGSEVFVGNFSHLGDPEAAPIIFTPRGDTWSGSPNKTGHANERSPSWSNLTFAVPGPSSSSYSVTLVNGTTDASKFVTSFDFYGSWVMVNEDGEYESLWYSTPSGTDGVYSLGWNASSDDMSDEILITLKKTPPSNPADKRI